MTPSLLIYSFSSVLSPATTILQSYTMPSGLPRFSSVFTVILKIVLKVHTCPQNRQNLQGRCTQSPKGFNQIITWFVDFDWLTDRSIDRLIDLLITGSLCYYIRTTKTGTFALVEAQSRCCLRQYLRLPVLCIRVLAKHWHHRLRPVVEQWDPLTTSLETVHHSFRLLIAG